MVLPLICHVLVISEYSLNMKSGALFRAVIKIHKRDITPNALVLFMAANVMKALLETPNQ